jgi:methyl-accepting chemotaxis protein WspA
MQQGSKLNQFVIGGCAVIISLTGIAGLFAQSTNKEIIIINHDLVKTHNLKSEIRFLLKTLVDAETGQRGFIITKSDRYLEPFQLAQQEIEKQFILIETIISTRDTNINNIEYQEALSKIKSLSDQKFAELQETITLMKRGRDQESLNLIISDQGKNIMDKIRKEIDVLLAEEDKHILQKEQQLQELQNFANVVAWGNFICISIVVIIVCLAIIFIPGRDLMRSLQNAFTLTEQVASGNLTVNVEANTNDAIGQLMTALKKMTEQLSKLIKKVQQSGIQVTSSSTQIASSGKQLEASITEQLASTNQVTAAAKQISATAKELLHTVEEVNAISQVTTDAADESRKNLQKMETTIRQLMEATNYIAGRLGVISEKANNINNIVITITKVADQTNLLSLNAAIEAEKAGEYGLGFAVVAREIRRLADQTAVATIDIEQMVKQMQSSVSTGVMEMDKFAMEVNKSVEDVGYVSNQIGQIIEQVQELTPRYELVSQGMEAQTQGAEQISEAMSQLSKGVSQTASALREINGSIIQLNEVAQGLRQEMSHFRLQEDFTK